MKLSIQVLEISMSERASKLWCIKLWEWYWLSGCWRVERLFSDLQHWGPITLQPYKLHYLKVSLWKSPLAKIFSRDWQHFKSMYVLVSTSDHRFHSFITKDVYIFFRTDDPFRWGWMNFTFILDLHTYSDMCKTENIKRRVAKFAPGYFRNYCCMIINRISLVILQE